jgi:DNA-binding NtrC family response regulator
LNRNSSSYAPVVESMHATSVMPMYDRHSETGQTPAGITDVLTIGEEATVFRPVQRALRPTGWAVTHAENLGAAMAWLESNVAPVVVTEADLPDHDWRTAVSRLRDLADAPKVVLITWDELPLGDALSCGAFDLLRRPVDQSDLLWAVATAWHDWMTRRQQHSGGKPCSPA